jgi:hypothetical protein
VAYLSWIDLPTCRPYQDQVPKKVTTANYSE